MKNNFLFSLLIDPITRDPLIYDSDTDTLFSRDSEHKYPIIESIPKIIVAENKSVETPDLHKKLNTSFNYIDHYSIDADSFDYSEKNLSGITKNEFRRLHESILREISDEMLIILDIGCGNGWVSKELVPSGKKVISMDISSVNPINALKQVQHENHAGLIADAFNLPIKENSIDCIIASEILEHVPDPKIFISNLVALLRNNGALIITTPYNETIEYNLCVHCNKPTPRFAHLHSFNEDNIIQFIPKTGVTWTSKKFSDKILSKIRSHIILRYLPFRCWEVFDNLFNKLFNKPTRLQIVIRKMQ